jgi:uncharacterized double-CXXCG motif protein
VINLFHIQSDDVNWGKFYNDDITASRICGLPGVKCSTCGQTWAMIGVNYPKVDPSVLPSSKRYTKPWPVDIETFEMLRDQIIPLVPEGLPLPPGTEFGPLEGRIKGKPGDFAWVNSWTLLIQQQKYYTLTSSNLKLPEVAITHLKKGEQFALLEFQIEPLAHLAQSAYESDEPDRCSRCGRENRKVKEVIVDRKSIPTNNDMFRVRDFPTYILVTEKFRNTVSDLNLTNITFAQIPTE